MTRFVILSLVMVAVAGPMPVHASDVIPSVSTRYATDAVAETPDFQRHIIPLLGRLGCNGRACHGSFQGQGGFHLSLFGYDFEADREALTGGERPRVRLSEPAQSLILRKPSGAIRHGGETLFARDGWEHRLIERWIRAGARGLPDPAPQLRSLEVMPSEILFSRPQETASLRIVAHWSDGSREDVTPLTRFQTNDDSIATVEASGQITAVGKGDTHIIAFYDNGIVAVPVVLPVSDRGGDRFPKVEAPTEIDRHVLAKLKQVGLVPSERCTDAEFLRRVSLDLTGTPPTPAEIETFLADTSPEKRSRKIDELLDRPTYAAWMTTRLCDITGNTEQNFQVGGEQYVRRDKSSLWYDWLYRRIDENVGYDEIVRGMILAVGRRPGQSDQEYFAEMSSYFRDEEPADFAARETMPFFWCRGRFSSPQTLRFSHAFLGVRLECAECHKHPYDHWTRADYQDFQAFFEGVRFRYSSTRGDVKALKEKLGLTADQDSAGYKRLFAKLAHEGTVVPWGEVTAPDWSKGRRPPRPKSGEPTGRVITPRLLGGDQVIAEQYSDPREPVMEWLTQEDNPYFARAIVNRVWSWHFGIGIVDPPDDMNLANPPSNGPLLEDLATAFVAQGYDLKWLHRTIANSLTYQRSWRPNDTNTTDERNFSRSHVRRLPAEVAFDAIMFATANEKARDEMITNPKTVRARKIGFPETGSRTPGDYALKLLGQPSREGTCDCERSNEPTLLQTIYLRNDAETLNLLDRPDSWLRSLKEHPNDWITNHRDELIREAWLRCLGRPPRPDEMTLGREQVRDWDSLRDLVWALLNTKEFILNH